jgi:hypothetical protein
MMNDNFIIEQNFTFSEYLRITLYTTFRYPAIRKMIMFAVVVGLIEGILNVVSNPKRSVIELVGLSVGPVIFILLFIVTIGALISFIIFKKKADLINGLQFRYNHYGAEKIRKGMSFSEPWRNFLKMTETKNFFFLFLDKNRVQALQKRMFRDEDQLNDFRSFVKEKIERI